MKANWIDFEEKYVKPKDDITKKNSIVNKVKNKIEAVIDDPNIISWINISKWIYDELKLEIEELDKKPSLKIILVWNNEDSIRYVNQKKKWAEYIWMQYDKIQLSDDITETNLLEEIKKINNDDNVDGFMIQLPLPKQIDENKVINAIDPSKDVDWFHIENQWKILVWDNTWLKPCTPAWVLELIDSLKIDLKWKEVTILWKSNIVWSPLSNMLSRLGATVTSCDHYTKDIYRHTLYADIVISATWVPKLVKAENIKSDAIIIDVWFTVLEDWTISWDCDFVWIKEKWAYITPVPGWVWPMTVAMLMKNTLNAYKNKN